MNRLGGPHRRDWAILSEEDGAFSPVPSPVFADSPSYSSKAVPSSLHKHYPSTQLPLAQPEPLFTAYFRFSLTASTFLSLQSAGFPSASASGVSRLSPNLFQAGCQSAEASAALLDLEDLSVLTAVKQIGGRKG